jgi:AcrR family transcriptional regulator
MSKARDPVQTRAAILSAAVDEFARRGFEGARIDAIARNTNTTRAMVYYYFESKEGLYVTVLESVYKGIRDGEKTLDLEHVDPLDAMRRLVSFTFDYYQNNPNFVKIVVAENQGGGCFIRKMNRLGKINRSIVDVLGEVLERGARQGVLRSGLDPVDVHMLIASLGWFQIANRYTFGTLFRRDFASLPIVARHKAVIEETVIRFVVADEYDEVRALPTDSHKKKRSGLKKDDAITARRTSTERRADQR